MRFRNLEGDSARRGETFAALCHARQSAIARSSKRCRDA